ncbi:MAG: LLM class flavin-dependent oxidoreductase [Nannocystaceae bacterium]
MRFSILDQSPVVAGQSPQAALEQTVDLARRAETLGYYRYWVSEHHNDVAFAHAAPEIVVTRIAAATHDIRVGAGGVLLSHYSPYKVAEQFNLLETLFPGRIDLGLGRAGGGEGQSDAALRPSGDPRPSHWEKLDHLLAYLGEGRGDARPFSDVHARPLVSPGPSCWILGTSPLSAKNAAWRGLPFAFGSFIDPRQMIESLRTYHQHFRPSAYLDRPLTNLTIYVLAAETDGEARELARSTDVWFVRTFVRGGVSKFPTNAEAHDEVLSEREQMVVDLRRRTIAVGTPEQVMERLRSFQDLLQVDELSLVTLTADYADRVRSYELIAGQTSA